MDRRQYRTGLTMAAALVACALFASQCHGQIFGGKGGGLLGGKGGSSQKADCQECVCTPYLLNFCRGQHDCCGCGCGQCGFHNWCGHGKNLGWTLGRGCMLPRNSNYHRSAWHHYCLTGCTHGHGGGYGYGGGGYGYGGGGYGPAGGGSDLFYNYYAPQGDVAGGVPTDMYPSPHATPHPAIQTYYTYQPWLPHEHLYHHNRTYMNYHSGPYGRTETNVSWGSSPIIRHYE